MFDDGMGMRSMRFNIERYHVQRMVSDEFLQSLGEPEIIFQEAFNGLSRVLFTWRMAQRALGKVEWPATWKDAVKQEISRRIAHGEEKLRRRAEIYRDNPYDHFKDGFPVQVHTCYVKTVVSWWKRYVERRPIRYTALKVSELIGVNVPPYSRDYQIRYMIEQDSRPFHWQARDLREEMTGRCPVCDWPYAGDASRGCVPGNCSQMSK